MPFRIFLIFFLGKSHCKSSIFNFPYSIMRFSAFQRTWRSDHSNLDCLESGLILVLRAVSNKAHWSMSALCRSRDFHTGMILAANASSFFAVMFSGSLKRKISTLLMLVSMRGTGRLYANDKMAADVYGQIQGNFMSSVLSLGNRRLVNAPTAFAHCRNLKALLLNHNHDRCFNTSALDAFAKV